MDWWILLLVTFIASTVQSATGFGFGLIAVSAFLIVLNSVSAIQLVIIITLAMSVSHWFTLRGLAPSRLVRLLSVGCLLGFPMGIATFYLLDLNTIKGLIAVLIILISLQNAWHLFVKANDQADKGTEFNSNAVMGVGVASGMMASSMAMPGPAVMLYLSRTALDKNQIRATILTFFLFSYGGALALQALLVGIEYQTWTTALALIPAALVGVFAGEWLSKIINQKAFKALVLSILMLTGLFMLANL